jgi:hypothetical protein
MKEKREIMKRISGCQQEERTRKMRLLGFTLNPFPEIAALVLKVSDE